MARVLNMDTTTGTIQLELDHRELMAPVSIQDNILTWDEEIRGSETWCQTKPAELGALVAQYVTENTDVLRLQVRVGQTWIATKFTTLQRVLCKAGILTQEEIDGLQKMIEGS